MTSTNDHVHAAGCLVWRRAGAQWQVLLIHRDRREDWSPPKGKLDPGESHIDAARREVAEEAGLDVTPWIELTPSTYTTVGDHPKTVRWWVALAAPDAAVVVDGDEADAFAWLEPQAAINRCTWPADRSLVIESAEVLQRHLGTDVGPMVPQQAIDPQQHRASE